MKYNLFDCFDEAVRTRDAGFPAVRRNGNL